MKLSKEEKDQIFYYLEKGFTVAQITRHFYDRASRRMIDYLIHQKYKGPTNKEIIRKYKKFKT